MLNMCAHRRIGAYWHTFPTFEQGRKAIWDGFTRDGKRIIDNVFPAELVKRRDNQQMAIELRNGSLYRVIGTDKIETVGAGPVGVLHSEYSIARPKAADLISPMLRENDGWEAYVYTPRGNNHGRKKFDTFRRLQAEGNNAYFAEMLTLYDTRAYDPDRTIDEERAEGKPEALIRQEYLCDWTAANVGAVYGDLIEKLEKRGGYGEFEHPRDGVFASYDLGFTDATAIWFWRINASGGLDFIDHHEAHGQPLSHYFDEIEKRGYEVKMHWLPHDAAAHTLATGSSVEDQFRSRYAGRVRIGPALSLLDGIQAARWLLEQPCRFTSKCADGVEALRSYHYEWDEDTKTYSRKPEHDWSSHTADAFRYAAIVAKHIMKISKAKPPPAEPVIPPMNKAWSLEQLWADRMRENQRSRGERI